MIHYVHLSYTVPGMISRYVAMDTIEEYVYIHLDEFGCLPRDERVTTHLKQVFGSADEKKNIHVMIRLSDEQAMKTAADRSEFKHPEPNKMKKAEKRKLRKISKRKRSCSSDDTVHKKLKDSRCSICLEDMSSKKNITLECDCVFHYQCIKKWLSCKKVCPLCEKSVDI